ncbi:MAG: single-stranded-DNA-specific exonuclease RecJ [Eubacteriales bacterium]|nr:single-stranded-DNA-specific exonuclease RecJ [Eubacteriales bacterium]
MKAKKWNIARPDIDAIRNLSKTCGYAPLTAAVLCARGLDTPEKASAFLSYDIAGLHNPFLLPDMRKAVDAIEQAIASGERIAVFGDYDVDGITSTCVLVRYLKSRGAACCYYIPDRLSEGYGLNKAALLSLQQKGVSLVITVDSGITASEEIAYAKEIGLKVVVTDHHECKDALPDALAVVNPKRCDSTYPFKELAGVGVVFKLICALAGPEHWKDILTDYLDLVAVGTIADVMLLQGENRIIVTYGLALLQQTENPGLRMLMRESGVETRRMTSSVVSFTLAPRINAAGRMGCADQAAELFLTDSPSRAQDIAAMLCCQNKERQNAENAILRQAFEVLQKEYDPQEDRMIVLWGENWHHGVIGIVSSRISDRYGCPTVLISLDGDQGKGSGRSVNGFNLFEALENSAQFLEKFGGHALAAGLTIARDQLPAFKQSICAYAKENISEEDLKPIVNIDCLISPDDITLDAIRELGVLEPYGMGNREPIFAMRELTVEEITPISSDRHLKMSLIQGGHRFVAMLFGTGSGGCPVVRGDVVDAAFSLEINHFRGRQTIQLMLKDIRLSDCELEKDHYFLTIYSNFINGGDLTDSQVNQLYPDRADLVAVWRHIISNSEAGKLTAPYNTLSRRISYESHRLINIGKLFVCLDVFSESCLLSYHFKNNLLHIRMRPFKGKADITKSVVLATLRHRKQQNAADQLI